jgi:hypothetical protein
MAYRPFDDTKNHEHLSVRLDKDLFSWIQADSKGRSYSDTVRDRLWERYREDDVRKGILQPRSVQAALDNLKDSKS